MQAKHMEASHVGGFDDFGECDKFGKISPNCQVQITYRRKQAMLEDLTILPILANMTNLARSKKKNYT